MMPVTFTVHLAGPLPEARIKISVAVTEKIKFFLPVEELPYIEERYSRGLDTLTKNILHIWKIWISVTEPGSMDMRTGTPQKRWYIM